MYLIYIKSLTFRILDERRNSIHLGKSQVGSLGMFTRELRQVGAMLEGVPVGSICGRQKFLLGNTNELRYTVLVQDNMPVLPQRQNLV